MAIAVASKGGKGKGGKGGKPPKRKPKVKTGRLTRRGRSRQLEISRLRLNGRTVDVGLKGAFTSADLEMTIEGASVLRIGVRDYKRRLMRSELTRTASVLSLDGIRYRLAKIEKQGDDLVLTFEDEAVWVLRGKTGKLKKRRTKKFSRAQFVGLMAREPKRYFIPFKAPEAKEEQPIRGEDSPGGGGTTGDGWRGKEVLLVGDSLAVGTHDPLDDLIGKVGYNGVVGRGSPATVTALRNAISSRHKVVIFDAGTNDSSAATLRDSLNDARKIAKDRPLVVLTVNSGANTAALNDAVRDFANNHSGVFLIDWRQISQDENLIGGDNIHPTGAGYKRRARLIANKLGNADGGGGASLLAVGPSLLAASSSSSGAKTWDQKINEGNLTVKGQRANAEQARNMSLITSIGREMGANLESVKGAIATSIAESSLHNYKSAVDNDSLGIYQQRPSQGWGSYAELTDVPTAIKKFYKPYLSYRRKGQDWLTASHNTQRSAHRDAPAAFESEAERAARYFWGRQTGAGSSDPGGSPNSRGKRNKPYEFSRGTSDKGENSWEAMGRLADEVRWTRFMRGGVLWFVSQEWLGAQRAKYRLREFSEGVLRVDFNWDARHGTKPMSSFLANAAECSMTVETKRYGVLPGDVIELRDLGVASGKWITSSVSRSLSSPVAELTLKRPQDKLPEPAPEQREVRVNDDDTKTTGGGPGPSGKRGKITGDTGGLSFDMTIFVELIAGQLGQTISVNSGYRPYDYDSNHSEHKAADLNIGAGLDTHLGDMICKAVLIVCGVNPRTAQAICRKNEHPRTNFSVNSNVTIRGNVHSVEIGWRTYEHHDHVHVGFDD